MDEFIPLQLMVSLRVPRDTIPCKQMKHSLRSELRNCAQKLGDTPPHESYMNCLSSVSRVFLSLPLTKLDI